MPTPTVANVSPLIQDLQMRGQTVEVRFVCPRSGEQVMARASVQADAQGAVGQRVKGTVTRSLMFGMRSTVYSMMRSVFGVGIAGRVAADLATSALSEAQRSAAKRSREPSAAQQQEAALRAFESVQQHFVWDDEGGTWISAKAAQEVLSGFQRQLSQAPVQHPYDRQILGRMLVELAGADGRISPEESGWLTEMLPPDLGSIEDVTRRPPLTGAELGATSQGPVRITLLMLASALALVDEDLDQGEQAALQRFGAGLRLPQPEQGAAFGYARDWVLDQAFDRMATWGGHDPHARAQLYALAGRLGLNQQEAEQAEARALRRRAR